MKRIAVDKSNGLCAALFVAFGIFFMVQSFFLEIGSALRMGPGYVPLVLSAILIVLGLVVLAQATRVAGEPVGAVAWRGMVFILPAPVVFGLSVRGLGFVPALFVTALIAAFASHRMRPGLALLLAGGLTLFATMVFSYALGLPFRRFGPWLPFVP